MTNITPRTLCYVKKGYLTTFKKSLRIFDRNSCLSQFKAPIWLKQIRDFFPVFLILIFYFLNNICFHLQDLTYMEAVRYFWFPLYIVTCLISLERKTSFNLHQIFCGQILEYASITHSYTACILRQDVENKSP